MASVSDDPVTTVKVPRSLRARITRGAGANGQTAAGFLTSVIDGWERDQRLAAVRRAYDERDRTDQSDRDYRDETEAWDVTSDDGLDE